MRRQLFIAAAAALPFASCLPATDVDESLLDRPRVLAVRADPAEAAPNTMTAFSALVAGPGGAITDAPLDWAFCTARRPLAELGPVSRECYAAEGESIVPIATGPNASARLPRDGCRLFGPDTPPPKAGEPAGRTVDPDATGGYRQPLRVRGPNEDSPATVFETRIQCGVAGAPPQIAREYRMRYRANTRPALAVSLDAVTTTIAPGSDVVVRVEWPECPELEPCGGAETYLAYDTGAEALVTRRESMRAAWYATAGTWALERSGRASGDPERQIENVWTAPLETGAASLFVVVRDERGGVEWAEVTVRVE